MFLTGKKIGIKLEYIMVSASFVFSPLTVSLELINTISKANANLNGLLLYLHLQIMQHIYLPTDEYCFLKESCFYY